MAIAGISSSQVYVPPPRVPAAAADSAAQQQAANALQSQSSRDTAGVPASDLSGPAGVQDALGRVAGAQGAVQSQAKTSQDQIQNAPTNSSPLTAAVSVAAVVVSQGSALLAYGASGAAQDYGSSLPRGNSYNSIA